MEIVRIIDVLPTDFDLLGPPAEAERIETIRRVRSEWEGGVHRFDRPGEALLSVREPGRLVGIGGITRDFEIAEALRMRRFYVLPDCRRRGAGRMMAEWLRAYARGYTRLVTVHAGLPGAVRFWERMGFVPVAAERHTHELRF
jgi:GNAT superfamily N-acetyltransferase